MKKIKNILQLGFGILLIVGGIAKIFHSFPKESVLLKILIIIAMLVLGIGEVFRSIEKIKINE